LDGDRAFLAVFRLLIIAPQRNDWVTNDDVISLLRFSAKKDAKYFRSGM